ncbi:transcriptional regulator [Amphibacillus sediminis]|uniref:transcriptional regulator n=1 Tax=Amphibacillus sediminis TaxID=360185 RepID=UPI00083028BC|nr:transcriptional regulator [Amphibacillus sediminis]
MYDLKITKQTFKKVEAEWMNYHHTLKEIKRLEEDVFNPYQEVWDRDENIGGGQANIIRDPTQSTVIRLSKHKQLNYLKDIVRAIDTVYQQLSKEYQAFVQIRYWSNRKLTWDGIADQCYISKRQAMRWRDEIVKITIEVLGWR